MTVQGRQVWRTQVTLTGATSASIRGHVRRSGGVVSFEMLGRHNSCSCALQGSVFQLLGRQEKGSKREKLGTQLNAGDLMAMSHSGHDDPCSRETQLTGAMLLMS
jgi:hypothetical protein